MHKNFQKNIIHGRDCSNMLEIPDGSVDLIISSPPYWSLIDYKAFSQGQPHLWQSDETYELYLSNLKRWHQECFRTLRPGRYCVINLATLERDGKTYPIPFDSMPIIQGLGFEFQFEIIWNKISGGRQSARNFIRNSEPGKFRPNVRNEYLLVFQKDPQAPFCIKKNEQKNKIEINDFFTQEIANNIWNIPVRNSIKNKQHPCPFPIELPHRLIELFSLKGEVILDPFMGIGTTAIAAKMLERNFIGYEIVPEFRISALLSLEEEAMELNRMICEYRHW